MRAAGKATKLNERGKKSSQRISKPTNTGSPGIDYRKLSRDMLIERIQQLELELGQERAIIEHKVREIAMLSSMVLAEKERSPASSKEDSRHSIKMSWKSIGMLNRWRTPSHSLKKQKKIIERSHLFDEKWYLKKYPDVERSGISPLDHYLKFGAAETRDPGPDFSTSKYVADNPAVLELGLNPLYHFLCETAKHQSRGL